MNSESGGTTSASGASLVKPGPHIVSGEMRGRMGKKRCSGWGGDMPCSECQCQKNWRKCPEIPEHVFKILNMFDLSRIG